MSPGTLAAEPLWCTRLTYFQFSSVQTRTPHSFSVGSATPCVGVPTQGRWRLGLRAFAVCCMYLHPFNSCHSAQGLSCNEPADEGY